MTFGAVFWGLASRELNEAIEHYAMRAKADQALLDVVIDEPSWKYVLLVTPIELARPETAARAASGNAAHLVRLTAR